MAQRIIQQGWSSSPGWLTPSLTAWYRALLSTSKYPPFFPSFFFKQRPSFFPNKTKLLWRPNTRYWLPSPMSLNLWRKIFSLSCLSNTHWIHCSWQAKQSLKGDPKNQEPGYLAGRWKTPHPTSPERLELCPNVLFPVLFSPQLSCHQLPIWALSSLPEMILFQGLSRQGSMTWCSHSARITIAHSPLQHSSAEITVLLRLLQALKVIWRA